MIALTTHLYRRLMQKARVVWLILLAALPGFIFAIVGVEIDPDDLSEAFVGIMLSVGFTYAIAALILSVSTLRDERDGGTLPYIYMRPIPRLSLAVSSLLAGMLAAVTIALGGWLATVLAGLVHGADMAIVVPGAALLLAAAVGYAAVFVPVGYLFSRSVLVGLSYLIIVELALSGLVTGLAQISIWRVAASIYVDVVDTAGLPVEEALGAVAPGVGGGLAKLAVILVLGTAVLTWAMRTRDAL